ncbi:MAG: sugar porter family MFS transporter [Candidatus Omnitrophota bacterium]
MTPNDAGKVKDSGRFVFFVAAVAALAGLLFGYDTGVISGAILFIKKQYALSVFMEEMIVSGVLLGAVIGAASSGQISDRFGRRKVIIGTAVIFAVGSACAAFSPSVPFLIAGRVIIGLAIGVASFTAPLYISEVSPPDVRGALVSLNQLAITCGIVLSYLIDYAFSWSENWRWMFAFGILPAVVLGVGMLFLPESPRWLISRSLTDKARAVLLKIHGAEHPVEDEIEAVRSTMKEEKGGWKELLEPWLRMPIFIGVALAFFQQVTGINVVIYYAPTIFSFAGFGSASVDILATAGVGIVNVVMTVVAIRYVDRIGRRPLLFMGLAGMIVALSVLGLAFYLPTLSVALKWIAAGCLVLYVASFAVSLGPIFWLLISEIYPQKVRGRAMGLATMANWLFNLIVAMTFLTLLDKAGKANTFWLYASVGLVGWVFCYYFVPETKGQTLENIEAHWRSGKSPRELK